MREQVQGQCDKIDITGALTVAKQAAFDALSAGQHTKFCRGNTTTTIIVRVKRYYHTVAVLDVPAEILNQVGIVVWWAHFNCVGEVKDDLVSGRCETPSLAHSVTKLDRKVRLCLREGLWRVLVAEICASILRLGIVLH